MDQIVSISTFVVLFALCLPVLSEYLAHNRGLLRATKYFIFAVYVLANLYETILFRNVMPETIAKLEPLWSYRESLALNGGAWGALKGIFTGNGGVRIIDPDLLKEIVLNILLYVPLGYLLPFTWPKLAHKRMRKREREGRARIPIISWKVVLIGFACSALTEITQLIFKIGWFEFDDMINNTLGCLIGYAMYALITRRNARA